VTSRNFQTGINSSIVNAFYLVLASIRWKLSAFHKVQWLHFTGAVDKFVSIWCDVSSGLSVPKITKSVNFWLSYFKKIKMAPFFGPPCTYVYFTTRQKVQSSKTDRTDKHKQLILCIQDKQTLLKLSITKRSTLQLTKLKLELELKLKLKLN